MIAFLLFAALLAPQPPQSLAPTAAGAGIVDVTVERQTGDRIESMPAGHVFKSGERIRLRLDSHFVGFLYVMDQGSSGRFSTVFPAADTGNDNRVLPDKQYLVPAVDQGWFEIHGPAGFDTLYFLLSPTALATPAASAFKRPGPVSSMKPRCNDEIFRARGECMDDSAGPAVVAPGARLPAPIAPLAGAASRDLVFSSKPGESTVSVSGSAGPSGSAGSPGSSGGPMLYTFRLAHQ